MERAVNLVLGGGGFKTIAYVGVLEELERRGIEIRLIACVSAGNLIGLAPTLGYTAAELKELILKTDFSNFAGPRIKEYLDGKENRISRLFKMHAAVELIRNHYGIDNGAGVISWLENFFKEKGFPKNTTFRQLPKDFRVLAFDLNEKTPKIFSAKLTPNDPVIKAVLASMALFPFFTPVRWTDSGGKEHLLADGGFYDICPMHIFNGDEEASGAVTIGVRPADDESPIAYSPIDNILGVMAAIVEQAIENQKKIHIGQDHWQRIIHVPTSASLLDFAINGNNRKKKEELCGIGDRTALEYFNKWEGTMFLPKVIRAPAEKIIKAVDKAGQWIDGKLTPKDPADGND